MEKKEDSLKLEIHNSVKLQLNQIENDLKQRVIDSNQGSSNNNKLSAKKSPEKSKLASAKKGSNFVTDSPTKKL